MPKIEKVTVTKLAFRIYKENKSIKESVLRLAELCVTINSNIEKGYDVVPLESDNLILLIREDVNGVLLQPSESEIKEVAEIITQENPSKSQLDWYIAEKQLLLNEIKSIIAKKRKNV